MLRLSHRHISLALDRLSEAPLDAQARAGFAKRALFLNAANESPWDLARKLFHEGAGHLGEVMSGRRAEALFRAYRNACSDGTPPAPSPELSGEPLLLHGNYPDEQLGRVYPGGATELSAWVCERMMTAERFAAMWVKDALRSEDGNTAELLQLWLGMRASLRAPR
jgi:hypothetical protein